MKSIAITSLVCLGLAACEKREWSQPKTEYATVKAVSYIPATTSSTSGGVGVSSSGSVVFTMGETVRSKEVYATVFTCEDHGTTFALTGKEVFQQAKVGARAVLTYRELFRVNDDGTRELVDIHTDSLYFLRE